LSKVSEGITTLGEMQAVGGFGFYTGEGRSSIEAFSGKRSDNMKGR
jgi:hypothetical protein